MNEFVDHFRIAELERARVTINERDLDAEFCKHRRVLDTDHATADHGQRLWNPLEVHDIVARQNRLMIARNRRVGRNAAGRDEELRSGRMTFHRAAVDRNRVGIEKARGAAHEIDVVPRELPRDDIEFALDDVIHAMQEIVDRRLWSMCWGASRKRGNVRECEDRFSKGFTRNRACME